MAEWRLFRQWSDDELQERLDALASLGPNFEGSPDDLLHTQDWERYRSRSIVGQEPEGPPEAAGIFQHAAEALADYQFSDPEIVRGHFDPRVPLLGRRMLLELRAVRVLRYLAGVVVGEVRREEGTAGTTFGFRYDTLEGHIETGAEWFLLHKDHATGLVTFRIEAAWRPGEFPNWWSRLGFALVGRRYQRWWHRQAHRRLHAFARGTVLRSEGRLAHEGPEVTFERM